MMACTHGDMTVELANALGDLARHKAEIEALRKDAERLLRGEFICQRCFLRKDSEGSMDCEF